jgi:Protein of unknown function (DUF3048) N-terminal domain/Protein of unknown function (DUF3048) C-terminal domain
MRNVMLSNVTLQTPRSGRVDYRRLTKKSVPVVVACCLLAACGGGGDMTLATSTASLSSGKVVVSKPTYPLTGLPASNAAAVRRPSLAVKIDNVEGAWPQAGLNRADIVFDILVEGGLTRLMAVYQSHGARLVGPIRSARPVDAWLLRLFHGGYFGFSGASPKELRPVRNLSHAVLVYEPKFDTPFWRRADHPEPDNLFSSAGKLYAAAQAQVRHGKSRRGPSRIFSYRTAPVKGATTRHAVIPFPAATAAWTWNGHQYLRGQDGRPDMLMSGARVSAANVVVMGVRIVGTGIFETNGDEDPLPVTVGSGPCWVLRNGVRVNGTWRRAAISAPLRLLDKHRHVIGLAPGRTWVELMPRTEVPSFRQ